MESERPEMGTPNDPTVGGPDVESHPDRVVESEMGRPNVPEEPEAGHPKDPNA
jgi:hypothetical protein